MQSGLQLGRTPTHRPAALLTDPAFRVGRENQPGLLAWGSVTGRADWLVFIARGEPVKECSRGVRQNVKDDRQMDS